MSIFKRGKKVVIPDSKDEDLGPGRRLGSTNNDTESGRKDDTETAENSISESSDRKIETTSHEDDDIVEIEPTHMPMGGLEDPTHNAGKKVVKKKITGTRSEAKTLFEGPRKCGCCVNWVEEPPEDFHKGPKGRAEHGDYALVVRKTGHGGEDTWKIKTITVFSPYILELFRKTLADYPGVATALDQIEFQAPFEPLLHRWEAIDKGLKEEEDLKARNHFNLFRQVVEPELAPHLKAASECEEYGVIPFESVWTIFPPGSLVTWEADGQSNIGKMVEAGNTWSYSGSVYQVTCNQVEWNGEVFGYAKKTLKISSYEGTRPVSELSVMPLDLKANVEETKKAHIQRGKAFEMLRGYHFKAYEGPALGVDKLNWYRKTTKRVCSLYQITGRLLIYRRSMIAW